jgi:hypothetical protein
LHWSVLFPVKKKGSMAYLEQYFIRQNRSIRNLIKMSMVKEVGKEKRVKWTLPMTQPLAMLCFGHFGRKDPLR